MKLMLIISAFLFSGLAFASSPTTNVQDKAAKAKVNAEREIQQTGQHMNKKVKAKKSAVEGQVGDEYSKLKETEEEAPERQ